MANQIPRPSPGIADQPLVGREREQAVLRDALAAALAGRGALVLIGGEAGIGKTALAEALLAEAADQGVRVLVGRCYDLAETPPYGPWVELFGRSRPGSDDPPHPPAFAERGTVGAVASQAALVAEVRDWLAALAVARPLVLLLDDLHWADPASLDLLRVLSRGLADLPLLLLATYRADELTRRHPLSALLPLLVREGGASRLDLARLTESAIRALVADRYALPATEALRLGGYLLARAEGNALFTLELLRTLEEHGALAAVADGWALGALDRVSVPALLAQVIAGRVERLGEDAARLLPVAAVIGQEVPLAVWRAVAEVEEAALLAVAERAEEAGLLAEAAGEDTVRFAHALVREALHAGVPSLRRRRLHRRAGETLAAAPSPAPDAVAHHFQQAGDARAVAWLIRAGVRARRAAAWVTAIERFTAAAALLAADEARARARGWLLLYSALLLRFSDTARAIRSLDEAARAAVAADDRVLAAYARYQRGPILCLSGEIRRGLAVLERGVAELEALPGEYPRRSTDQLAFATIEALLPEAAPAAPARPARAGAVPAMMPQRGELVHWLGQAGRYREALAIGEPFVVAMAAALGEDHLDKSTVGADLGLGHAYAALGRPADARRQFARARAVVLAAGDAFMAERSLWVELLLVVLPYQADALAERAHLAAEATRAWGRAGGAITTATYASQSDLLLALLDGRWVAARQLAEAGLASPTVNQFQGAIVALGVLARQQGDPAQAWARVHQLHPAGPDTAPGDCFFPHGIAAQALAADLALDAGDLATAGRWIEAHERWLAWSGAVRWRADHELLRARHARAAGEAARARRHADAALRHATHPRQPLLLLTARRLLGELATDAGHHTDAADHLAAARALADACAAPYERALTLLALAELRATTGDRDGAQAALGEAGALLSTLEARPARARADALAARLTAMPPPREAYPAGLTAREVEVLRLVAMGKSNAQIADELVISRNTVQRHVGNILNKTGLANRTQAASYAHRAGFL